VDVLVTLDKDLLEDAEVREALDAAGVRVLTVAEFLEALDAEAEGPLPGTMPPA
jgi:predicted nucleic acid-binding protein